MEQLLTLLGREVEQAFAQAGYDPALGKVSVSNRPDLCEFQCNGAMAGAKTYHKAPLVIAEDVTKVLQSNPVFVLAEAVKPGFINLKADNAYIAGYLNNMAADPDLSVPKTREPKEIIVDYGGANVAKPLHVGPLRSAVIGESIKRMLRFMGHHTIGDVHLGDWGLQMGLIFL